MLKDEIFIFKLLAIDGFTTSPVEIGEIYNQLNLKGMSVVEIRSYVLPFFLAVSN